MKYAGEERRRAAASPARARRRTVTSDVLRQVKGIELRTRTLVNSLFTGDYRSVFRGQGIEFAEVRAYQEGDDFRAIDWNVSARMGHPFVKTYMEERELTLLLVVDQSGSLHVGRPYTKAGLAVEVAAVLALAAARHNDRVGALMFAHAVEFVVRPAKGRPHALRVIRDLLAFSPRGRGTNLAEALRYASRLLRHHSIVAVLSVFAPSGLGPREASMYGLMLAVAGEGSSLGATVLNRVAITLVEVLLLVVGGLLLRSRDDENAVEPRLRDAKA